MKRMILLAALALACGGDGPEKPPITGPITPEPRPTLDQTYRPSGHAAAGDVFVHLFDWKWTDIASECENWLGPAGFKAVQVSPPQEHSITPSFDWSERYQPVSYSIDKSRSGTRAEFIAMVNRCRAVGVGIYVDAVINHMTNFPSPGTGSNGTQYSKYSYPGLYTPADFHPACALTNYNSAENVQDCELFSLPDLDTKSTTVRQKIADYLLMLARLGVEGFRIDAAKHIQQGDLDAIMKLVDNTLAAEGKPLPYWFLEVVGNGQGEALGPRDYFGAGYSSGGAADITEFTFVGVGDKFSNLGTQKIWQLNPNGTAGNRFSAEAWNMMPGDKAVVFLQNHDTQHQNGFGYRSGAAFRLANVWMLAQPYGYPTVLSSFAFSFGGGNSMGPPSDAAGWTKNVKCADSWETAVVGTDWVCEHRDPHILRMVNFRRVTAGTDQNNWWDNGANAIAFGRGTKGFVIINRESTPLSRTFSTALPNGMYCDVLSGKVQGSACTGVTVVVAGGSFTIDVPAMTAIALHEGQKL